MKVELREVSLDYAKGFKDGVDLLKNAIRVGVKKGSAREAIDSIVTATHASSVAVKEIQEIAVANFIEPHVDDFVETLTCVANHIKDAGINPPQGIELKLNLEQED